MKTKINIRYKVEWILWPAFFLFLWAILLRAQNPDIMSDDSGEMIAGSFRLGLPHPPGYPLFDLIGRLFSILPIGSIAFRYNLLSAIATLTALGFVMKTCSQLIQQEAPSYLQKNIWFVQIYIFSAGVILLFCRSVFAQSLTAKGTVYTLTLLLVNVYAYLRLKNKEKALTRAQSSGVIYLWALGLCNHWQTVLLLAPFLGIWFFQTKWKATGKNILFSVSIFLIGISLYLYLPLRAIQNPLFCWGNPTTLTGLEWVVSRKLVYGLEPLIHVGNFYFEFLNQFSKGLTSYWFPFFTVAVIFGIFFIFVRRIAWGHSLLILYICVWMGVFFIHEPENAYLINIYLVSLSGLWVLFGFVGLLFLIGKRLRDENKIINMILGLFLISVVFWAFHVFRLEDKSRYTFANDFGLNVLHGIPRGGVLVADGDQYVVPILYEQTVLKLRPDVIFTPSVFLFHDWGWEQLAHRRPQWKKTLEMKPVFGDRFNWLVNNSAGKDIFFYSYGTNYMEQAFENMSGFLVPIGLSYRWFLTKPNVRDVVMANHYLSKGERLRGLENFWFFEGRDLSTTEIYRYYGDQYFLSASWFESVGDEKDALLNLDQGIRIYPQDDSAYNNMAILVGCQGYLELAKDLCLKGLLVNPESKTCLLNLANTYWLEGQLEKSLTYYKRAFILFPDSTLAKDRLLEGESLQKKGLSVICKPRNQKDYHQLALFYESRGLFFLGDEAARIAEIMSKESL